MMTDRTAARVAGILFIDATVAFSVSVVILDPILGDLHQRKPQGGKHT
jgi:hypothetical protein